ncbi:MAG: STAS domain-containing protein [Lachnospiraceae bacterium]|nr:STAS domain-containing protein [Lachnospiraceae bacterium]
MEAVIEKTEDTLFISPVGRLDTVSSAELTEQIKEADADDVDIEMNFEEVEYISSAGLRLLVALQRQAKAGDHTLVIRNVNKVVEEVFKISGFNKKFTVL